MTAEHQELSIKPITLLSIENAKQQVPELFSLHGNFQTQTIDTGAWLVTEGLTSIRGLNLLGQAMVIMKNLAPDPSYVLCKTIQDSIGIEGLTTQQLQVINETLPLASVAIIVLDQPDNAKTNTSMRAQRIERELQRRGILVLTKFIIPTGKNSLQVGFYPKVNTLYTKVGSDDTEARVAVFTGFGAIDETRIAEASEVRKAYLRETLKSKIFSLVTQELQERSAGNISKAMELLQTLKAYVEMLGLDWNAKHFGEANWTAPYNRLKGNRRATL